MKTVFDERVDSILLNLENLDGEIMYSVYEDGIDMSELIQNLDDNFEKRIQKEITKNGFDLKQPLVAHLCNSNNPFDTLSVVMCKDFYINVEYVSEGSTICSSLMAKFGNPDFFDDNGNFKEMKIIFAERL